MKLNQIGLPKEEANVLIEKLNTLLANYQMHYQNLRSFHWNISGRDFFELHVKFEEFYTDAQEKIDMIAERVLTIGGTPTHTFSAYIKASGIAAAENVSNGEEAVEKIVEGLAVILENERPILALAAEVADDGTADLMTQFISQQEKEIWMLNAWLK